MPSEFESSEVGTPHRERMLDEYDRLLSDRRRTCVREKASYFRPDTRSCAAYERSLKPYRRHLTTLLGWPLNEPGLKGRGRPQLDFVGPREGIRIYRVWIPTLGPLRAYGVLLLPDAPPPYRFLISQHGALGIPEMTADFFGSHNYNDMSLRLAHSGYAVFAPQLFLSWDKAWGSTRDQQKMDGDLKQVGSSLAALHVHMLTKITDWIVARPDARENSVGFVGLSYGGFCAMVFAACDPRVQAVVASCIINDRFRYNLPDRSWFGSATRFLDEELCALICPRPLYVEFGTQDSLFRPEGARAVSAKISRWYAKLKQLDRFRALEFDGTHEFNPASIPIEFLQRHFPA